MQTVEDLQPLILKWATDKDLIKPENSSKQSLKLLEEVGETAKAILKNDTPEIIDGIGDIFVVLIILAAQEDEEYNFDLNDDYLMYKSEECLNSVIYYDYVLGHNFLNVLCSRLNLDLFECCLSAWNEIKDRKGKTVDGTFIKN